MASGTLDLVSDIVFVSLLQDDVLFFIALSSLLLSIFLLFLVAVVRVGSREHFLTYFLLLLTTGELDDDDDGVGRYIILLVEDLPFLTIEIFLVVNGKKLNGLDWVIWSQSLAFTILNICRSLYVSTCSRQKHRVRDVGSAMAPELVSTVQHTAQALVS